MTALYAPGAATLLVREDHTLLMSDCPIGLRDELWALFATAPGPRTVTDLLDLLTRGGIGNTGAFTAVITFVDQVVTLSRGSCRAVVELDAGERREFDGTEVSTWAERRFPLDSVRSVTLTAGGTKQPGSLPLDGGVVLADQVTLHLSGEAVEPLAEAAPAVVPLAGPAVLPEADPEPDPEPKPEPEPEPEPEAQPEPDPAPVLESSADRGATLSEPDDSLDHLWGATIARSPEEAAVRPVDGDVHQPLITGVPPTPGPAAPPLGDHDGLTVARSDLAALRAGRPAPGAASGAPARRTPKVSLVLPGNETVVVDRPVYVGRAPKALNNSSSQVPRLVTVDSPNGFVSSTHVEFHTEDENVLVKDVSTNGTLLTRPGSEPERLDRGVPTLVSDGCLIGLGEDITIRVALVSQ